LICERCLSVTLKTLAEALKRDIIGQAASMGSALDGYGNILAGIGLELTTQDG